MALNAHGLPGNRLMTPRFIALSALLIGCAYFTFAFWLTGAIWPDVTGGYTFNTMLRSLLEGRVDVDPHRVGMEGYERDGLTYTYFGILPALLRLPVVSQLWRDWTLISSVFAAITATLALHYACLRLFACSKSRAARAVVAIFAATLVLSGPGLELLGKPSVYIEAIAWSYAFACISISVLLPIILHESPTPAMLLMLAASATAAVLTRISTGLGLLGCVGFVLVIATRTPSPARQRLRRIWPAVLVCAAGIAVCLTINQLRWGSPLKFNDFRYYTIIKDDAERKARAEQAGSFNLARLPYSLAYYFVPERFFAVPASSPTGRSISRLFDWAEGPPAGLVQTWPLWFALGAGLLLRGRRAAPRQSPVDGVRLVGLLASLLVAPLLILTYLYLAFRYRVEFAPAVLLLAMAGCRQLTAWLDASHRPRLAVALVSVALVLAGLQIFHSCYAALAHGCAPWTAWTGALTGPNCILPRAR